MSYCSNCGEKLEGHYEHCPECGTRVNSPAPAQQISAQPDQVIPAIPAVSLNGAKSIDSKQLFTSIWSWIKRYKWICIGVVAFLIVLAALFGTAKYLTDGDRLVAKLEEALKDKDASKLAALLKAKDESKLTLNADTLKPLMTLYKNNPSESENLLSDVKSQLRYYEENHSDEDGIYNNYINLRKDGKQFLLFDRYVLEVSPVFVKVYTNFEGTVITVNGKEMAKADSSDYNKTVGPLVPGTYTVKAEFKGEYTSLTEEEELDLLDHHFEWESHLYLDGDYLTVDSNYNDAKIFIDDKDIGLQTGDQEEIGPISMDGDNKVHVEKEFPWGVIKSEAIPVTSGYLRAEINPVNDVFQEEIMTTVQTFFQSWVDALNSLDAAKVTSTSETYKESLAGFVQQYIDLNQVYEGKLTKIVYDLDSVELNHDLDGNYTASISAQVYANEHSFNQGDTASTAQETISPLNFELSYVDGHWIITGSYDEYWFNDTNTKEVIINQSM